MDGRRFGLCLVRLVLNFGLVAWGLSGTCVQAADDPPKAAEPAPVPENPFPNRLPAADLEGGVEWLNASGPISMKDLRGKIVLLDFWTFCCINCMHVLPDLEYLEKKYPNDIVVIGVHSAKFDNEKETGNIRKAILRYEIAHPVVNDAEMVIWRKFAVRAWPTLALVDPEGYYCGYTSGEGNRELLEKVIDRLIAYHRAKGTLDETPVEFALERHKQPPTPLRFPGKLLADAASNRLFISDSNHNRIVVTTLKGELLDIIGSGSLGRADGAYNTAQFDHPQGMALVGKELYVADTENHLLRVVDLEQKTVRTLAGTGEQGHMRMGTGSLTQTALNSPWDLLVLDNVLYIAMAGPHQIWSHKLGSSTIHPYAGSGREDILNGSLEESALAQPSGLATDGRFIYVVDSEGSAVRTITTKPDNNLAKPTGTVTTLAGTSDLPSGRSLFEFGDVDGVGAAARLQHPLGIAYHDGHLFVADSYNHKIRQINIATKSVTSWLSGADPAAGIEPSNLAEPAGLAIAGNTLYIADTNNHRICQVDLDTKAMKLLTIPGLEPPAPPVSESTAAILGTAMPLEPQTVAAGDAVTFEVTLKLPVGYKLNPEAAVTYRVSAKSPQMLIPAEELGVRGEADIAGQGVKFTLPCTGKPGQAELQISLHYTYCRDTGSGLCKLGTSTWLVPLNASATATEKTIHLESTAD
ncbi:redoxin domain-containing protein [bacterium]|nr:redoxin domain-containing protein [bacterium]